MLISPILSSVTGKTDLPSIVEKKSVTVEKVLIELSGMMVIFSILLRVWVNQCMCSSEPMKMI